ncbi:LRP2-binding protein-like [Haliotis rubra]|uniref:LRP2-binding protein-like n=1 Tax=Haliotis rubra TaxID=36100 RepID=UPI001EE5CAFF|nr:LRP2-binding protein-like [Haliotis rubra]XP_046565675.1 LRP2-binding protein-like [Haliotis rubra]
MAMKISRSDVTAEHAKFTQDSHILSDIAQQTQDAGMGKLTDEELVEKLETLLLERIKKGDKSAYFQLALFYFEQDMYDKARVYFERSKDFNYQSLYQLGVMLYDGIGCEQDTTLGVEYLMHIATSTVRQAKHLKHAAEYNIGRAYFQGYGVRRQSDEEAERWWLLAADDGNPAASVKAQSVLGMFYSREDTVDLKKAFFWHSEACGNGSLESQGALGVMYEHGVGVKYHQDSAYICLKEASDRGNVYAMGNLISHYYRRKLYTKAADLSSKVAMLEDIQLIAQETECLPAFIAKGIALASFYHGRCLHEGLGVKQNKQLAQQYYSRSYQFDPDICARLQNVTQHGVI